MSRRGTLQGTQGAREVEMSRHGTLQGTQGAREVEMSRHGTLQGTQGAREVEMSRHGTLQGTQGAREVEMSRHGTLQGTQGAREVEQESYISSTDSVHDSVIRQLSDCTMRQVVEVWRLSFCDSLNMLFSVYANLYSATMNITM